MSRCPHCGAPLRSPRLCEACQSLLEPAGTPTPFEVLGLEPAQDLPLEAARKRLLDLARRLHPDYFGSADARTRALAERGTAELNAAFQLLSDDFRRADWLVTWLGGPREQESREMPPEFLQEVLAWNEEIERLRGEGPGASAALAALERDLRARQSALRRRLSGLLVPLPPHGAPALREARALLNAARYLERALGEMAELRLEHSAHRG
jgi:molecular chaperone HscB